MKIFSAQLKGTTTLAADAVVTLSSGSFTGSFSGSIAGIDLNANNTFTSSTNTFTSSASARLNAIETVSASNIGRLNSIEAVTASNLNRLSSLENKTGSLASTGSNTFIGTQVFTGSVYITSDLIVQGSSSLQNITASAVSIGTNKVILNTDNPAVRYAGISVIDSGSTGLTGSILWDSTNNNWLYQNPSGSSYVSAKFISGPTSQTLGNELGLVTNYLVKAVGDDHISSSAIYDDGTIISLKSNTQLTGSLTYSSTGGGNLRIYGASGTHQWDVYLNGVNLRFSDNTGGGSVVFDNSVTMSSTLNGLSLPNDLFSQQFLLMGS